MNEYENYIKDSKATKDKWKIKRIVAHILIGLRKNYNTKYLAARLNKHNIFTIMSKRWNSKNLQMQILKMQRLDPCSSLAQELNRALSTGEATQADMALLCARVR